MKVEQDLQIIINDIDKGNLDDALNRFISIVETEDNQLYILLISLKAKLASNWARNEQGQISDETAINVESGIINEILELLRGFKEKSVKPVSGTSVKIPTLKDWGIFFSFLVIPVVFLYLINRSIPELREVNKKHKYFYLKNLNQLEPPVINSSVFTPHQWLFESQGVYSNYNTSFESKIVASVRKEFPELNDFLGDRRFNGLYSLCSFLLKRNEFSKEFEILKYYVEDSGHYKANEEYGDPYRYYYNYINYNYVNTALTLLKGNQFKQAKFYLNEAWRRLTLIDTPPDKYKFRNELNGVILLNVLLSNTKELITNYKMTRVLIDSITSCFEYGFYCNFETLEVNVIDKKEFPEYYYFLSYLHGVSKLNSGQYEDALKDFKISMQTRNNSMLKEISILGIARSSFWKFHDQYWTDLSKGRMELIKLNRSLEKLKSQLTEKNFKSDIDYYMTFFNY